MVAPFQEVQGMALILEGCWEKELTARVQENLKPGDVFVDVGANMGYYTLLASRLVGPDGLVLAYEPSPSNLQMLLRNLTLNQSRNVAVFSLALSDRSTIAKLWSAPSYNTGVCSLRGPEFVVPSEYTLAPTSRLDELRTLQSLADRIRLIKVDAEGHDMEVLRGAAGVFRSSGRLMLTCELSPQWAPVGEVVDFLGSFGFVGEYYTNSMWRPLTKASLPTNQCNAWFWRG
jgi:FkbM family methyltransferase